VVAIRHVIFAGVFLHHIAIVTVVALWRLQLLDTPANVPDFWLAQHICSLAGLLFGFKIGVIGLRGLIESLLVLSFL